MTSQWAAVGAETDPLRRARQLQRSWERLLAEGALAPELPPEATAGLRPTIVESWRRSLATGLDPTDLLAPIEADESEMLGRWFEHPLGSLTHVLTEQLRKVAEESRGIVVVTDASGLVLHRLGHESLKERAAAMNLVEGARYSEAADGTNGIGTALAADHAFQVFAFEHFNERHHDWVCSGAPVHDPVSGQTVGLIDVSSLWKYAHPRSLELVTTAARTIEQYLADARHDRDARLRRRYSDFMTRSTDLLVDRDGYVLDGAEPATSPLDIPDGGGEVVLGDGSVAVAAPLGRGEAYLLRQGTTRRAKSAPPVTGLERAEERARELAAEQAALRQVATLVARESSPDRLFAVVTEQVARIFDVPHVRLVLYEPDGSFVVGGFSEGDDEPFPIGSRWPLDSPGVTATVRETGRPARVEDYAHVTGEVAGVIRDAGMHSAVACPIVVERRLWGAMVVLSPLRESLPEDTEARLTDFTELVATAIANAESREALAELAEEQAALRRVAMLVAQETSQAQVFAAIAREAMQLLRTDAVRIVRYDGESGVVLAGSGEPDVTPPGFRFPLDGETVAARIFRQREPARHDDYKHLSGPIAEAVRAAGIRSVVGVPVHVEGRLWGAITTGMTREEPLPPDTESRLDEFTVLMATAISNAEAHAEVERLAEEQASLRRVATLVARDVPSENIFAAVSEEVSRLVGSDMAVVVRFEDDEPPAIVFVGVSNEEVVSSGTRWELEEGMSAAKVLRTGRSARSHVADLKPGPASETVASLSIRSTVASPITVEGRLWGAVVASSTEELPLDTEDRVEKFTELVATAIANAESGEARAVLTEEHAALRRVATLVARDAPSTEVFESVATEVGKLLETDVTVVGRYDDDGSATAIGSWSASGIGVPVGTRSAIGGHNVLTIVAETGKPARVEGYEEASGEAAEIARRYGWRSSIAAPIVVEDRLWGVMLVASQLPDPFPAGAEERLAAFTDLIATAVSNTEARHALERVAAEQAALRRVATLVAHGITPEELFQAVAAEVGMLFESGTGAIVRFEDERTVTVLGATTGHHETGQRVTLDPGSAVDVVRATGRSARFDTDDPWAPDMPSLVQALGIRSAVASPIVVQGELWGALTTASLDGPLPLGTERRLTQFTELVGTAIANAESGEARAALADEQTALRRVATLVARGAQPMEVFWAVSDEVSRLFGTELAAVGRFEPDGQTLDLVGAGRTHERWDVADFLTSAEVLRTGRSARTDAPQWESEEGETAERLRSLGIVSTVASPIVVEGQLWGVMLVASTDEVLPVDTEERLEKFTEIVATAIANAESREARAVLTKEQAALRRVATLVAQRASPPDLFEAVAEEVGRLLSVGSAVMGRYEPDGSMTTLASWSTTEAAFPTGGRWPTEGTNVAWMVLQTGRSARLDDLSAATDPIGVAAREAGIKSAVGSPIIVEGSLWGVIGVNAREELPPDTEQRLEKFAGLVTTAIANAESKAELAASRRRIVAASDEARRRIERDLHDGVQQQLVSLGLELRVMKAEPPTGDALNEQLASVTEDVGSVLDALVEIARGIHPAILSKGGLAAALRSLARRSAVPVDLHVQIEGPLPDEVEVAAYYVAAEALTNVAKYARASVVRMDVTTDEGTLTLMVRDDGVGGADPGGGSGLVGLQDRVEALGGTIKLDSSAGSGTCVVVTLPIATEPDQEIENFLGPPQEPASPASPA